MHCSSSRKERLMHEHENLKFDGQAAYIPNTTDLASGLDENQPKSNLIDFRGPNIKTISKKSSLNPTDTQPKIEPLSSLIFIPHSSELRISYGLRLPCNQCKKTLRWQQFVGHTWFRWNLIFETLIQTMHVKYYLQSGYNKLHIIVS